MIRTSNPSAWRGVASRAATLLLVMAGLIAGVRIGVGFATGLFGIAVLVYAKALAPRHGDFVYAAASAIIIPDWLGFFLTSVFLMIPIWASPDWPREGALHPSVWILWPMAVMSAVILYVGWRSESFALSFTDDALVARVGFWRLHIPYAEIQRAQPWSRDVPRWMRAFVPILLASGQFRPAGAVMLAQQRRGIELVVKGKKREL